MNAAIRLGFMLLHKSMLIVKWNFELIKQFKITVDFCTMFKVHYSLVESMGLQIMNFEIIHLFVKFYFVNNIICSCVTYIPIKISVTNISDHF